MSGSSQKAVWVVLPITAACLAGVVWLISAIPAPAPDGPEVKTLEPRTGDGSPPAGTIIDRPAYAIIHAKAAEHEARMAGQPPPQPAPPPPPAPDPEDEAALAHAQEKVRAQVVEQFEARRDAVMERCWPKGADDDTVGRLTVQFVVDAEGRELARGMREHRDAYVQGLSHCFSTVSHEPFDLERPGRHVTVDVDFEFP